MNNWILNFAACVVFSYLSLVCIVCTVHLDSILNFILTTAKEVILEYKQEKGIKSNYIDYICIILFIMSLPIVYLGRSTDVNEREVSAKRDKSIY